MSITIIIIVIIIITAVFYFVNSFFKKFSLFAEYFLKLTEHLKNVEKIKLKVYHANVRRLLMKCIITIDKEHEEEVLVFAHEKTKLVDDIETLINNNEKCLIGYSEGEAYRLLSSEISCFMVENNKVYALMDKDKLQIKLRLYQIEEMVGNSFVKINQSCIANIIKIKKFDTSVSGMLTVTFKNGYRDYVSRRNLKSVKERLGIK